jgi:hypothetical protein
VNLDKLTSLAGQTIAVGDLLQLNKSLQAAGAGLSKASGVNYPLQGVAFDSSTLDGGALAPLVPQSIQPTLDVATYTQQHIVLWRMLTKTMVSSTLHEAARVNSYGTMQLDPFIAEGGGGNLSEGDYERQIVKIKFMAEKKEITDVATMVSHIGYSGVSKMGLQQQTQDGTLALMGKLERSLFWANEDLSDLHFDGILKQITGTSFNGNGHSTPWTLSYDNSDQITDLEGEELTPQQLITAMYKVHSSPNFGIVNEILVEPRVFGRLVNIATTYGRFPMEGGGPSGGQLVWGSGKLMIAGPMGLVPITPTPLLLQPQSPNTGAIGETPPTAVAGSDITTAVATDANANFKADDAGTYQYKVVAVGDGGASAALDPAGGEGASFAVAAGQRVSFTIADAGTATSGDASIRYYRVYRTAPDGSEFYFLGEFPRSDSQSSNTVFYDYNQRRPNTAPAVLLQNTPDVMYWAQLLDFLRRPLAQVATTVPFLLMLFGSPFVKVPTKNHVILNSAL